jgi:hypothetical protein
MVWSVGLTVLGLTWACVSRHCRAVMQGEGPPADAGGRGWEACITTRMGKRRSATCRGLRGARGSSGPRRRGNGVVEVLAGIA